MALRPLLKIRTPANSVWKYPAITAFKRLRVAVAVTASPQQGQVPLLVQFQADVSGVEPFSFAWTFGDGGSDTIQNPVHVYRSAGSFKTVLKVVDALRRQAEDSVIIQVQQPPKEPSPTPAPAEPEPGETPAPVASLSAYPNNGEAPLSVQFNVSVSGGRGPFTYFYDFKDGQFLETDQAAVTHLYEKSGAYEPAVLVRDQDGKEDSASTSVNVQVAGQPSQQPLSVEIFYSPSSPVAGSPVNFESQVHDGTAPYDFRWDFGDGETSPYQNPTHYYSKGGQYRVTLTVKDAEGKTGSTYVDLVVSAA